MAATNERVLDLRLGALREQVTAVVDARVEGGLAAATAAAPFGCYLFDGADPASELARHVERTVFFETFGNTPELLAEEYGPYEHATAFICVVDHRRRLPVGAARVIVPNATGFKTIDDLDRMWRLPPDQALVASGVTYDPARTWDMATLAVDPEYRQALVSEALLRSLVVGLRHNAITWTVAVLDIVVLRLLQLRMRRPFTPFAGAQALRYLDSPASLPVWANVDTWAEHVAAQAPELHAVFLGPERHPAVLDAAWDRQPAAFTGLVAPNTSARRDVNSTSVEVEQLDVS